MKLKILIAIVMLLTFSCTSDDENSIISNEIIGRWNLLKIINGSIGGESNPDENNTHYYIFKSNQQFERVEIVDDNTTIKTGTFLITDNHILYNNTESNMLEYIELIYDNSEVEFFNCFGDYNNKQIFILNSSDELINNLPMACDGDGYRYVKAE